MRRVSWNCDGEGSRDAVTFTWALDLRECPWSAIGSETWQIIDDWRMWKDHGICPLGESALMDCPAYISQAVLHCEDVRRMIETERSNAEMKARLQAEKHGAMKRKGHLR